MSFEAPHYRAFFCTRSIVLKEVSAEMLSTWYNGKEKDMRFWVYSHTAYSILQWFENESQAANAWLGWP